MCTYTLFCACSNTQKLYVQKLTIQRFSGFPSSHITHAHTDWPTNEHVAANSKCATLYEVHI